MLPNIEKGDLVRRIRTTRNPERTHGVVCRKKIHHPDCSNFVVLIAEVVWNTGEKSWIDVDSIEIISKGEESESNLEF